MKVLFAGTCQVAGLKAAARALRPDLKYRSHHLGVTGTPEEIRAAAAASDLVVTQIADRHAEGALLGPAALAARGVHAVYVPTFVFRGLHPDLVHFAKGGGPAGPVGPYHSAVVAAGCLMGMTPRRIARLPNAHVLSALGLLDGYPDARAATSAAYAAHGYDLAPAFARWEAGGTPFVHTPNHPAIAVLAEIGALAMARAGLVPAGTPAPEGLDDPLASSIVSPVLPAVARRHGMAGSTTWLEAGPVGDPAREVSLVAYAERARVAYAGKRAVLLGHRGVRAAFERLPALLDVSYPPPARSLSSSAAM